MSQRKKMFSKLAMARLFQVNRTSIYDWLARGCPGEQPGIPGRPSLLAFEECSAWRKVDLMRQARQRLKALKPRKLS
jgi:hypothetical protein